MEYFQKFNPFRVVTVLLCVLLLASCGKKLPKPRDGKGPKYDLFLSVPASTLNSTETVGGNIEIRAKSQQVSIKIGYGRELECRPGTENGPNAMVCKIVNSSFKYNDIKASSEDYIGQSTVPSETIRNISREGDVRRTLVSELSQLKQWSSTIRFHNGELSTAEFSENNTQYKNEFKFINDIVKDLESPKRVAEIFVANSINYLPDHPVAEGAVWHVTIPNNQFTEFEMPTAITLESVYDRNGEKIAKLSTISLFKISSPTKIQLPTGERCWVQHCNIEAIGEISLNLTRQMEERNSSSISMTYSIKQSGQTAKCKIEMTTDITRSMSQ